MPNPSTMIRHAVPADVPAIAAIHLEGWRWAYQGSPLGDTLDGLSNEARAGIWTKILARQEDGVRLWVADREESVVGFVCTGPPRGLAEHPAGTVELYALYQLRAASGTGVGHALVTHALADLRRCDAREVYLWAMSSNQRARRFYERAGWRSVTEQAFVRGETQVMQTCYCKAL